MRTGLLWLAALLLSPIFTACADLPSTPKATPGDMLADCRWNPDGSASCDPVESEPQEPPPCDPYLTLGGCDENCEMSEPGLSDPEYVGLATCNKPGPGPGGDPSDPGGGDAPPPGSDPGTTPPDSTACEQDCPTEEETEDNDICPQPLRGKTLTTLINVAGRNHEFQFTGTMYRVNSLVGRSPAWYRISGPTASKDAWWIAQSGNIQLVCWGRWHLRNSVWLGTVVVQATDVHMVMGPGHPDFEDQPPYPPTSATQAP